MLHKVDISPLLPRVDKPARYLGGEANASRKDPAKADVRFALCFPDIYEIAESHLGIKILYHLLNAREDTACERIHAPWLDMGDLLRQTGTPLFSLESRLPARAFDVLGFTLQYELSFPTVLHMLELGGVPLRAKDRGPGDPIVIAGGPVVFNVEPLAEFLDGVLLGDGEEAVHDLVEVVKRVRGKPRPAVWEALAEVEGMYVPALWDVTHGPDGRIRAVSSRGGRKQVRKRVVGDLNKVDYPTRFIIPHLQVVHDRVAVEIQRGCTQGCRFCQAGFIYRPTRQRDPAVVRSLAEGAVQATGLEEWSVLSLSAGDYACLPDVLGPLVQRFAAHRTSTGMPSMRTETLTRELADLAGTFRKTSFTLAPEAATDRMRRVISKNNVEKDLVQAADNAFAAGWEAIKLYFMLGLPTETDQDLLAIVDLAQRMTERGRRFTKRAQVTVSVSSFVPKPHTPFQWAAQVGQAEIIRRQELLREGLKKARIPFKWHESVSSVMEGVVSRGDRRLGAAFLELNRRGARLDGWSEVFDVRTWRDSLAAAGLNEEEYLRARDVEETLPWDHLGTRILKKYLRREWQRAQDAAVTPDCVTGTCHACGVCDFEDVNLVTFQRVPGQPGAAVKVTGPLQHPRNRALEVRPAASHDAPVLTDAEIKDLAARRRATPAGPGADLSVQVVRVQYTKLPPSVFLSHLETMTALLRVLRRAEVPVAYSGGFHPKPRINLSPALPTGLSSRAEFLDVELAQRVEVSALQERLQQHMPQGMDVVAVTEVPVKSPAVQSCLRRMRYHADLTAVQARHGAAWVDAQVERFTAAATLPLERKTKDGIKPVDVRAGVPHLARADAQTLAFEITVSPERSPRPGEVLRVLLGLPEEEQATVPLEKVGVELHLP